MHQSKVVESNKYHVVIHKIQYSSTKSKRLKNLHSNRRNVVMLFSEFWSDSTSPFIFSLFFVKRHVQSWLCSQGIPIDKCDNCLVGFSRKGCRCFWIMFAIINKLNWRIVVSNCRLFVNQFWKVRARDTKTTLFQRFDYSSTKIDFHSFKACKKARNITTTSEWGRHFKCGGLFQHHLHLFHFGSL